MPSVSAIIPVVPVDVQRRRIERNRENFRGGDTEDTAFGSTKRQMSQRQAIQSTFGRARVPTINSVEVTWLPLAPEATLGRRDTGVRGFRRRFI